MCERERSGRERGIERERGTKEYKEMEIEKGRKRSEDRGRDNKKKRKKATYTIRV